MKPTYEIDGERLTSAEISARYGIERSTFNCRLRRGMDVKRAAEQPTRPLIMYTLRGVPATAAEICKALYTSRSAIEHRAKRAGVTMQQQIDAETAEIDALRSGNV